MYYFDQAATSLQKPKAVAEAVYQAISSGTIGNPSRGGHGASIQAARIVYRTREAVKELFRAENFHVVFTKNATEALNVAIKGLFQEGDHILTTAMEHNSVLRPLYELESSGVNIDIVQCKGLAGTLLYEQFEELRNDRTKAVVVTHASNVTGNVNDLEWISQFCQKNRLQLIVDASQTAGIVDINLENLAIDILCFTGHKSLYGPQGTGGLCIKKGMQIRPLLTGGSGVDTFSPVQPTTLPERLEAGTVNVHGIAGLHAGIQYVLQEKVENLEKKTTKLTMHFYEAIRKIKGVRVYGDFQKEHAGVVAFNIESLDSSEVSSVLFDEYEIAVRPGAHCAPLMHKHFGTEAQGVVRFSFSSFNTLEEINYAVKAIEEIASESWCDNE